jgi:3-methyl-2-oxobutanoate hydroxymethyltransferase
VNPKITALQQMKREGQKIVGVVVYDYQMAQIADRAGVDIVSVGDSVGVNMWGQESETAVTLEQMLLACKAVRRGVSRALVSCDVPSAADPVAGARMLVNDGGADLVKVEANAELIRTIVDAGVAVWAQMRGKGDGGRGKEEGGREKEDVRSEDGGIDWLVEEAKALEQAGASLIDFRHSGPIAGLAVASAVSIPVIGGLGGGPWLDGRVRLVMNAIGYAAAALDDSGDRYANVARIALDAVTAYAGDVRAGRQIKGK